MEKANIILLILISLIIILISLQKQINIKQKQIKNQSSNNSISLPDKDKINILLRQAARYSHAARQDEDILIALLHANYGSGYLFAVKDIFPETQIVKLFPSYKQFKEFERLIISIQDEVNTRAVKECPSMVKYTDILTHIGGEGRI